MEAQLADLFLNYVFRQNQTLLMREVIHEGLLGQHPILTTKSLKPLKFLMKPPLMPLMFLMRLRSQMNAEDQCLRYPC